MISIREKAYEIGKTTQFSEHEALIAGAFIAEDYPNQADAVRVLTAMVELASVYGWSLPSATVYLLPAVRGDVIAA